MSHIVTSYERRRGCGFRKPGGLYLVCGGLPRDCHKLPLPLVRCPACNAGIKPTRGWQWVEPGKLFGDVPCGNCHHACPLAIPSALGRTGLLWIGERFYPTPAHFVAESLVLGCSRRITQVPRGFEPGKTWVMLAHRKACALADGEFGPGIFQAMLPLGVDYIVKGTESEEELEKLTKRGFRLVRVIPVEEGESQPMPSLQYLQGN